jgi:hypothetical protein
VRDALVRVHRPKKTLNRKGRKGREGKANGIREKQRYKQRIVLAIQS